MMIDTKADDEEVRRIRGTLTRAGTYGDQRIAFLRQREEEVRSYIRERQGILEQKEAPAGLAEVWGDVAMPAKHPEKTWQRLQSVVAASLSPFHVLLEEIQQLRR
jgi:hypothetical protein